MSSFYEQLMAAKGAPKAANSPNSSQMRLAPINLQSAMRKYAEGGGVQALPQPQTPPLTQVSAADISGFVQANLNNPQAIAAATQKYGVSAEALSNATGYSSQQINDYFNNAGLNPFGVRMPSPINPYKPEQMPQRPDMSPQMQMPERPKKPIDPVGEPQIYDYTMPVFPEKNQQNSGFYGVSPGSLPGTPDPDFNSKYGKPDPNFDGSLYEPLMPRPFNPPPEYEPLMPRPFDPPPDLNYNPAFEPQPAMPQQPIMPQPNFDEDVIEQKKTALSNVLRELGISPIELQEMIFEDKMKGNQRSLMSLIQAIKGK